MGRQWLHAKRAIVNLKKGQTVGKLVKEITVAAKLGGGDPEGNARLHAAVEKAKKASVTRDVIERAIAKGSGTGSEKMHLDHVVFEGYAPHKVPVIVECMTDNHQRLTPEIRYLFKKRRARRRRQQQVPVRPRGPGGSVPDGGGRGPRGGRDRGGRE